MELFGCKTKEDERTLIRFRAGRMLTKGSTVYPLNTKGWFYLFEDDNGMVCHCWKNFKTGHYEYIILLLPLDAEFVHIQKPNVKRVYMLRLKKMDYNLFFWMQEPDEQMDQARCDKVNKILRYEFKNDSDPAAHLDGAKQTPNAKSSIGSFLNIIQLLQGMTFDSKGAGIQFLGRKQKRRKTRVVDSDSDDDNSDGLAARVGRRSRPASKRIMERAPPKLRKAVQKNLRPAAMARKKPNAPSDGRQSRKLNAGLARSILETQKLIQMRKASEQNLQRSQPVARARMNGLRIAQLGQTKSQTGGLSRSHDSSSTQASTLPRRPLVDRSKCMSPSSAAAIGNRARTKGGGSKQRVADEVQQSIRLITNTADKWFAENRQLEAEKARQRRQLLAPVRNDGAKVSAYRSIRADYPYVFGLQRRSKGGPPPPPAGTETAAEAMDAGQQDADGKQKAKRRRRDPVPIMMTHEELLAFWDKKRKDDKRALRKKRMAKRCKLPAHLRDDLSESAASESTTAFRPTPSANKPSLVPSPKAPLKLPVGLSGAKAKEQEEKEANDAKRQANGATVGRRQPGTATLLGKRGHDQLAPTTQMPRSKVKVLFNEQLKMVKGDSGQQTAVVLKKRAAERMEVCPGGGAKKPTKPKLADNGGGGPAAAAEPRSKCAADAVLKDMAMRKQAAVAAGKQDKRWMLTADRLREHNEEERKKVFSGYLARSPKAENAKRPADSANTPPPEAKMVKSAGEKMLDQLKAISRSLANDAPTPANASKAATVDTAAKTTQLTTAKQMDDQSRPTVAPNPGGCRPMAAAVATAKSMPNLESELGKLVDGGEDDDDDDDEGEEEEEEEEEEENAGQSSEPLGGQQTTKSTTSRANEKYLRFLPFNIKLRQWLCEAETRILNNSPRIKKAIVDCLIDWEEESAGGGDDEEEFENGDAELEPLIEFRKRIATVLQPAAKDDVKQEQPKAEVVMPPPPKDKTTNNSAKKTKLKKETKTRKTSAKGQSLQDPRKLGKRHKDGKDK